MTQEEKARAYDEAIERARYWEKNPTVWSSDDICQKLFPELKESEDEKIREALIKYFSEGSEYLCLIPYNGEQCVAWLEKQGKQKSVWSEDDEYQINTILHELDLKRELCEKVGNKVEEYRYDTQYNWLKSLKDRVQPEQKQEWSEEDEKRFHRISDFIWEKIEKATLMRFTNKNKM